MARFHARLCILAGIAASSWSLRVGAPRNARLVVRYAGDLLSELKSAPTEEALAALVEDKFDSLAGDTVMTLMQDAQAGERAVTGGEEEHPLFSQATPTRSGRSTPSRRPTRNAWPPRATY